MAETTTDTTTTTNGTATTTTASTITAESDWRAFAPEDVKADLKSLESVKDISGLIKTAVHGQKALGASIRLPGKDAKPEDVAKAKTDILGKLRTAGLLDGAPESPDKYTITRPTSAAALGWNEDAEGVFRKAMHAAGATNASVQAAIDVYSQITEAEYAAESAERARVDGELKKEWGPNYAPNRGLANTAVQKLDDEIGAKGELIGMMKTYGVADHPLMVKAMAWLGRSMWEHDIVTVVGGGGVGESEAEARMNAMINDKTHAFNNPRSPDYPAAADEFLALQRIVGRSKRS